MTNTLNETSAKRQTSAIQAAIVEGLEDIKAQDIRIFDTTALSPLFERVVIASATSSRQTKALAASVRDKLSEAGFAKPRTEGEENGEWIIVDCGVAVVHIMQPAIRAYYRLEEIWGDKPLKASKPRAPRKTASAAADTDHAADGTTAAQPTARKTASRKTPAVRKTTATAARKTTARKTTAGKTATRKAAAPAGTSPASEAGSAN